jgi:hypothetical protein
MLSYPADLRDRKKSDVLDTHSLRRGDPHSAGRRIDTQVNVLDVFKDDINRYAADVENRVHQYSR